MTLAIALGAAVGGILRFWFEQFALRFPARAIPYGTLAANLLGSFALGVISGSDILIAESWTATALVAFTGAFTTFGGFIGQGVLMLKAGLVVRGWVYLGGTTTASIAAAWLGMQL